MSGILTDALFTGLPLVPLVLGIFLIFRIREDMDLTITGSFASGGATAASWIAAGGSWQLAMLAAAVVGALAGAFTVALHLLLRVPIILGGLVTALGIYSVNLRIMGTPALSLGEGATIFTPFDGLSPAASSWLTILVLFLVGAATVAAVGYFLTTDLGLALRASGSSSELVKAQGANEAVLITINVLLANALCGLSGALLVQVQGFADVNMGATLLVAGLGSMLLGELVTTRGAGRAAPLRDGLIAIFVGAVLYRAILTLAIELGLDPKDLQLATALTLVAAFALNRAAGLRIRRARADRPAATPITTQPAPKENSLA